MDLTRARMPALFTGLALAGAGLVAAGIDWPLLAAAWPEPFGILVLALAAGALARWRGLPPLATLLAALLPALALGLVFAGPGGMASTALLLAGGLAAGTLLPYRDGLPAWARWLAGLGLLAALAGWLLPLPLHHRGTWAIGLLVLVAWRRTAVREDLRAMAQETRDAVIAAPWSALATVAVVSAATLPAWLPMRNADDLALRLIPTMELLTLGHGRLDIGTQVWALAPWSTDLLHALAGLLAGEVTTGPLNLFWMIATLALVRRLALAMGADHAAAWWAGALVCSLPLSAGLSGSLQVESATPALLAALALVVLRGDGDRRGALLLVATLAGVLLGAKASNALFLAPVGLWWLLDAWRTLPLRWLPLAIALAVFAGGSSYVYATWLAGNPVLPILNASFQSPWFATRDFVDATWQTGLRWDTPWAMVVDAPTYFEGRSGAAGLLPVLLLPGIALALLQPRVRGVALAAIAGTALVFWQVQYLRYVHPGLALLAPAALAALWPAASRARWRATGLGAVVLAQLALMPAASWMFTEGAMRTLVVDGATEVERRFVPERLLLARLAPTLGPADRVLFASSARTQAASLPTHALSANWHAPRIDGARAGARDAMAGWQAVVERAGANLLITHAVASDPGLAAFLRQSGAIRIDAEGSAELYRLPGWRAAPLARREDGVLAAGLGIEGRPGVRYLGTMRAEMACDAPGEPIAVGWTLHDAQGQRAGRWAWVTCGHDGRATTSVAFTRAAPEARLHVDARPAQSGSTMTIEGINATADVREDFKAEGEQYPRVRRALCRGRCGDDPPTLELQR